MLPLVFLLAASIFFGTYLACFLYIKSYVKKPWDIKADDKFEPEITILVPVHNEETTIESKLENIKSVSYPIEKMEVVVADDASDDSTLEKVEHFMQRNPELDVKLVRQNPRAGKSATLNKALSVTTKPIVVVSDADTIWPPHILRKALPYLADERVGAVSGRGVNANVKESWVTKAEDTYLQLANMLRLGESKIHSTIRFEGGFCAYKRNAFDIFDCETGSDDSGTALEVTQNGFRAIMVPEAMFYTNFPTSFQNKTKIKMRRANQLINLWVKCLRLMVKGKLHIPKRIVVPELMLFIFYPIILLSLMVTALLTVVLYPFSPFSIVVMLLICGIMIFARGAFIEVLLDNLILFCALITFLFGRRYTAWEKSS